MFQEAQGFYLIAPTRFGTLHLLLRSGSPEPMVEVQAIDPAPSVTFKGSSYLFTP